MLDAVSAHAFHAQSLWSHRGEITVDERLTTLVSLYGLSLKYVRSTSALLFGADACIVPLSNCIRIRRDLDVNYRREILAHEMAHVILGHDLLGETIQHRDYVSSYGKTERIERMADNLASFLLVTECELKQACRDSDSFCAAAELLHVSRSTLIRRLTQHRSPVAKTNAKFVVPVLHQLAACDYVGNVCIDGEVGTGKTEVLLERLRRIANHSSSGHSRILVVTYLRRHMVYLFERLNLSAPLLAERVHFTTFHDYAADVVLRNFHVAGWSETPSVVGRGELIELLGKMFPDASHEELSRKSLAFRQVLRCQIGQCTPWEATLNEQLYELNYIHNGSIGDIAAKLMEVDRITEDEADRWDAIFVDNYEQLTYAELTVLRLAGKRARFGLTVAGGGSSLPFAFRGVSDTSTSHWKMDCNFQLFHFDHRCRLRDKPQLQHIQSTNHINKAIDVVRNLHSEVPPDEKIVVAAHHNSDVSGCRKALVAAHLIDEVVDASMTDVIDRLYTSLDETKDFDLWLNQWWSVYREGNGSVQKALQSVLVNAQMFMSHLARFGDEDLPVISIQTFLKEIRPFHQYQDIQLSNRISLQTLHSLSGMEADHLVIIDDWQPDSITPEYKALYGNACDRATRSLTVIQSC